jgi:hypothetical protein
MRQGGSFRTDARTLSVTLSVVSRETTSGVTSMGQLVEASALRIIIREKIKKSSLEKVAADLKIRPAALLDLLNHDREPGTRIAKELGYRRLSVKYEKLESP